LKAKFGKKIWLKVSTVHAIAILLGLWKDFPVRKRLSQLPLFINNLERL
jgi:hypothetical protein